MTHSIGMHRILSGCIAFLERKPRTSISLVIQGMALSDSMPPGKKRWKYKGYSAATPYVDGEWTLDKKAFVNVNRDKVVHATYHATGNLLVLGVSSDF